MRYNAESSPAHKNAIRLANFFKTRMQSKVYKVQKKKRDILTVIRTFNAIVVKERR